MQLGTRMKRYESNQLTRLIDNIPVILRVDGRAFHTLTNRLKLKDYSKTFSNIMLLTAMSLCEKLSNVKLAYVQSDEISILMVDNNSEKTQPWFDNKIQKMTSVASSIATVSFYKLLNAN